MRINACLPMKLSAHKRMLLLSSSDLSSYACSRSLQFCLKNTFKSHFNMCHDKYYCRQRAIVQQFSLSPAVNTSQVIVLKDKYITYLKMYTLTSVGIRSVSILLREVQWAELKMKTSEDVPSFSLATYKNMHICRDESIRTLCH